MLRRWEALARPGRRAKRGRTVRFPEGLEAIVESVGDDGRRQVLFGREIDEPLLERIGNIPLPPYIRREPGAPDRPEDREAYQTVFAREPLAVAAPTAGLHFTEEVLDKIRDQGVVIADLTLAVGPGTFKPVTSDATEGHSFDPEDVVVPAETLGAIARARQKGSPRRRGRERRLPARSKPRRACRAACPCGEELRFAADIFITPGFEFRVVDALLTNFHLPRSTLLMLVSAFAGREKVLAAYEEAIRQGYLFYSYGDAMFIA